MNIAIDEPAVYDMFSDTTVDKSGKKDISIKSTGTRRFVFECAWLRKQMECKTRIHGRESTALNGEFGHKCVFRSSQNT